MLRRLSAADPIFITASGSAADLSQNELCAELPVFSMNSIGFLF
jgi:hypothetical protein